MEVTNKISVPIHDKQNKLWHNFLRQEESFKKVSIAILLPEIELCDQLTYSREIEI